MQPTEWPPARAGEDRPATAAAWVAAAIAVAWAAWVYGPRAIHPASVEWLLHGDAAAHHVGVQYFLRDAWRLPLGVFEGWGEVPTGVVYTDGIPWVALLAKVAHKVGLWPAGWQYFGLWMLLCHGAAAWWGVRLLQAFDGMRGGQAAGHALALVWGGLFFTISPALMMRAYGHESLMGHAFVLAALTLALRPWRFGPWLLLVALAIGVHVYLAWMAAIIGVAAALGAVVRRELPFIALMGQGAVAAAALAGVAWLLGYFAGSAEVSTHGHGLYSANLLTWVDPMAWVDFMRLHGREAPYVQEWSRLLGAQAQATGGQYEGYAWLGSGMLALVAVAAVVIAGAAAKTLMGFQGKASGTLNAANPTNPHRRYWPSLRHSLWPSLWPLLLACLLLAAWAVSARITLGAHTLAAFEPPPGLAALLGVFRASGRFIWPLTYLLMAWALVVASRSRIPLVLPAALALQAWDTSPKWLEFHARFRVGPPAIAAPVHDPRWGAWLQRCPRLEWVAEEAPDQPPGRWIGPSLAAGVAGAHVLPAPTSHPSPQVQAQRRAHLQALLEPNKGSDAAWGPEWRADTVYVFPGPVPAWIDTQAARGLPLALHTLDGYAVLVAAPCLAQTP